jgi:hypothetical protein
MIVKAIKQLIPLEWRVKIRSLINSNKEKYYRIEYKLKVIYLQNWGIRRYPSETDKLILFLVPGADPITCRDRICGGVMSMVSLYEETSRLVEVHGASVIMSTYNGETLLHKYTSFENRTEVFRFSQLRHRFRKLREAIIHLPEVASEGFLDKLSHNDRKWLEGVPKIQINILNQNVRLMPSPEVVTRLKMECDTLTITTAHRQYCNERYRHLYGAPMHEFSVWISPEKYQYRKYLQKENLIIVSPDFHPLKDEILKSLKAVPGLKQVIISDVTYEQYKELIARAKWAITFGEGLDSYFIESIFSGAVSFAVYNQDFFTEDFRSLRTVYESYENMLSRLVDDIIELDDDDLFNSYQQAQYNLCREYYDYSRYRQNLISFYEEKYMFS